MKRSRVAIAQAARIELAVEDALGRLPVDGLVRGKRAVIKPNDTWASAEDKTAVTQPETLRAVLDHIRRIEPSELIVTGGAGAAETDDVFSTAGLTDVVKASHATFVDHNRAPFVEVELEYASDRFCGPFTSFPALTTTGTRAPSENTTTPSLPICTRVRRTEHGQQGQAIETTSG
jgi:uncharacterized protein (DUF362 family)